MSLIVAKDINKIYRNDTVEKKALININLDVDLGEFIIILGASGSGKSTLLNILGTIDSATSGTLFINDVDITKHFFDDLTIFRRENIGIIYQDNNLIDSLTVEKNIMMTVLLSEKEVDIKYFNRLVDFMDLRGILLKFPNQLSGGEKQRISIARALLSKPLLVLADEPTGNLDHENSINIMKLLKECNEEFKQTIIMVTHDLNLINYASRVIKITDGLIESDSKYESNN